MKTLIMEWLLHPIWLAFVGLAIAVKFLVDASELKKRISNWLNKSTDGGNPNSKLFGNKTVVCLDKSPNPEIKMDLKKTSLTGILLAGAVGTAVGAELIKSGNSTEDDYSSDDAIDHSDINYDDVDSSVLDNDDIAMHINKGVEGKTFLEDIIDDIIDI